MKAYLMYRDRDLDLPREVSANQAQLAQDLDLTTLCGAMSLGDPFLFRISQLVLLTSLHEPELIAYRQHVLSDCLSQPAVIRQLYDISVSAIAGESKIYKGFRQHPSGILRRSIEVLELFVGLLKTLREVAVSHAASFSSEGLTSLCATLAQELDDEYFSLIDDHLRALRFHDGILVSARLGKGNKGIGYVLRSPSGVKQGWKERIGIGSRSSYSFEIHPRDEAGARALSDLRDRGLNLVASALAQSTDHILDFFSMLRSELGFYVCCLNLGDRLVARGEPVCIPVALEQGSLALSFTGLYDPCLALRAEGAVVGNDLNAANKSLVMITGANSGGKSTFLRSVGLAHLMMQCGMFVGAQSFQADVCRGVFTHFIRDEDAGMDSGRLDEELRRMSLIADRACTGSLVLFNESFSGTNEREGSELARQIVRALLEAGMKVCFVTHLFDLARSLCERRLSTYVFLRAERQEDGGRTFRLVEGDPLPTSYGQDMYDRIGGW